MKYIYLLRSEKIRVRKPAYIPFLSNKFLTANGFVCIVSLIAIKVTIETWTCAIVDKGLDYA